MKPKLKNAFQERPIIVYKKNGNLEIRKWQDFDSENKAHKKKSGKKHIFCSLCYTIRDNRCYRQVEKKTSSKVLKQENHKKYSTS